MNIVNAVKDLRNTVALLTPELRKIAAACMESPIFNFSDFEVSPSEIDPDFLENAPLPFQSYRIYVPELKHWVLVSNKGDFVSVLAFHPYQGNEDLYAVAHLQFEANTLLPHSSVLSILCVKRRRDFPYYRSRGEDAEFLNNFEEIIEEEDVEGAAQALAGSEQDFTAGILFYTTAVISTPGRFLATKTERRHLSKPVEWQRCHQHIVVLDRRHEANSKQIQRGAVVHADYNKSLTRMAHSRRAHFRILSSDRFKAKRGQRIAVKSSWVGPDEWCDRSNQIYKILH